MYLVDIIYTPMYDYIYVYLIFYVLDFNTPSFMIRESFPYQNYIYPEDLFNIYRLLPPPSFF